MHLYVWQVWLLKHTNHVSKNGCNKNAEQPNGWIRTFWSISDLAHFAARAMRIALINSKKAGIHINALYLYDKGVTVLSGSKTILDGK